VKEQQQQETCYANGPDKRRRFLRETVPAILASARRQARDEEDTLGRWMHERGVLKQANPWDRLGMLHEAARGGRYVETRPRRCDRTKTAADTLAEGGDCDQWAAVILACCNILGIRANLCAFGDDLADTEGDPYQHVAVVAEVNSAVAILDPKGNQAGSPFNVWPPLELTGAWK